MIKMVLISLVLAFTQPIFAAADAHECEQRMISSDQERQAFIAETASRPGARTVLDVLERTLRAGPPSILVGAVPVGRMGWVKPRLFGRLVYGQGLSDWGDVQIVAKANRSDYVIIQIYPRGGDYTLTQRTREKLQALYPSLRVHLEGVQRGLGSSDGSVPETINFELDRGDFANPEEFETQARSLTNVLLGSAKMLLEMQLRI